MIKLVIFDLSNVCYNLEDTQFLIDFAKKHGIDHGELDNRHLELVCHAEIDEIGGREVWKRLLEHFKIEEDIDTIINDMVAMKVEWPETLALVKQVRSKVKTSFFTNYNKDYWELIEERLKPRQWFDWGLVSYQAKRRKPAPEGFKIILEHFGVKAEEAVFTDDSASNLVGAKKLGIHTIHFQGVEKLKEELAALGVKV